MEHVVIIGNGISGVTAARHIRKKSNKRITIISSETKYFFSRTALMYIYMGHMPFKDTQPYEPHFWKKNRIDLVQDFVQSIDYENKKLKLVDSPPIHYDQLILAVGSKSNKFGWKGQDNHGVQGLYSKKDLDLMERNSEGISDAVIVGGGLIGVEMAEMLLTRNINVTFLIREERFWGGVLPLADGLLVKKHLEKHHGLTLRFEEELEEIIPDDEHRVREVITKKGERIPCQFVGLTAGVSPNVDFLKDGNLEIGRGILVNPDLSTNIPDVYAIGDCAQFKIPNGERKSIEQVWYTGRMMGETVALTLTGNPTDYNPGIWFNSAKFFDLEYQTYGWVWNDLKEGEEEFIWAKEDKDLLLHFVFDKETHEFKGINTFGIRLRHELFDQWLKNKTTIEEVIRNLRMSNFDPEFFKKYEKEIVQEFNQKFSSNVQLAKNKWWQKALNV
jgi:NADPH-dependent 2,4-dienoyl-CoA reductase/sulfur reductase-like enzyme